MKKHLFQCASTDIKQSTIDKITDSLLGEDKPTRSSLSISCGVSAPTVGKYIRALCDSKLAEQKQSNGSRNENYIELSESLHVAVIDLSSATYKMRLMRRGKKLITSESVECNTDASPDENLIIFLSKCIDKIAKSGIGNYFISVIYADNAPRGISLFSYAPSKETSHHIEQIISEVMRRTVIMHLTVSEAVAAAVKYRAAKATTNGSCFISIGNTLSMSYIRNDGFSVVSSPERFLLDGKKRSDEALSQALSQEDVTEICARLVNLAASAFSPDNIVIESDTMPINASDIRLRLKHYMPLKDTLPEIDTRMTTESSLTCLGASSATISSVIRSYVSSSNN